MRAKNDLTDVELDYFYALKRIVNQLPNTNIFAHRKAVELIAYEESLPSCYKLNKSVSVYTAMLEEFIADMLFRNEEDNKTFRKKLDEELRNERTAWVEML